MYINGKNMVDYTFKPVHDGSQVLHVVIKMLSKILSQKVKHGL